MGALNDTKDLEACDENSILVLVPSLVLLVLAVVKKNDDDDDDEVRQRVWQMVMRETGGRHWW